MVRYVVPRGLFDFLVNRHLFEDRIVLLELKTLGSVLFVLGGDVTAGAGLARGLMLGTLHNHLNAVPFFCHDSAEFSLK
jgi:hypothetical protein